MYINLNLYEARSLKSRYPPFAFGQLRKRYHESLSKLKKKLLRHTDYTQFFIFFHKFLIILFAIRPHPETDAIGCFLRHPRLYYIYKLCINLFPHTFLFKYFISYTTRQQTCKKSRKTRARNLDILSSSESPS